MNALLVKGMTLSVSMSQHCLCSVCIYFANGGLAPGKGSERKRFRLWFAQNKCCFYCDDFIEIWSDGILEHIIPKSKGGTDLVLSCKTCDLLKQDMSTEKEFSTTIKRLKKIKNKVSAHEQIIGHKSKRSTET